MIKINADFHMHGLYSMAVSQNMTPKVIGDNAPLKGLNLIGTADILNAKWIKLVKEQLNKTDDEGLLEHKNGIKFLFQTEVEDNKRVHHIILFPSWSKVEEVREQLQKKSKDLDSDGRPRIWLNGGEIADIAVKAGCEIGPSHAFTPWTGFYKAYNTIKECYGNHKIHFLELGLSADTNMADRISELHELTFMSNSDAHSPWPNKLGREFNELTLNQVTYEEIINCIKRKGKNRITLNVGFNPLEGKYHKTRCINQSCLTFYEPEDAEKYKWKCPNCGKTIKKGADSRVHELADLPEGKHPEHRPEYKYIIPLNEIIALAHGINQTYNAKVQNMWKEIVEANKNEIDVLLTLPLEKIKDETVRKYIELFRQNKIKYLPGGGGVFGKLLKPEEKVEIKTGTPQKQLGDF